jgi:hypothetical protein
MEGDVGLSQFSNENKKRCFLNYSCSMLMATKYFNLGSIQPSVDIVDGPYRPPKNTVLLRPANELHTQQLDNA